MEVAGYFLHWIVRYVAKKSCAIHLIHYVVKIARLSELILQLVPESFGYLD